MTKEEKQAEEKEYTVRLLKALGIPVTPDDIISGESDESDPDTLIIMDDGTRIGFELTSVLQKDANLGYISIEAKMDHNRILKKIQDTLRAEGLMGIVQIKFTTTRMRMKIDEHVQDILNAVRTNRTKSEQFGHKVAQEPRNWLEVIQKSEVKRALPMGEEGIKQSIEKKIKKYKAHLQRRKQCEELYLLLHYNMSVGENSIFVDSPKNFDFVEKEWFNVFNEIYLMSDRKTVCELSTYLKKTNP